MVHNGPVADSSVWGALSEWVDEATIDCLPIWVSLASPIESLALPGRNGSLLDSNVKFSCTARTLILVVMSIPRERFVLTRVLNELLSRNTFSWRFPIFCLNWLCFNILRRISRVKSITFLIFCFCLYNWAICSSSFLSRPDSRWAVWLLVELYFQAWFWWFISRFYGKQMLNLDLLCILYLPAYRWIYYAVICGLWKALVTFWAAELLKLLRFPVGFTAFIAPSLVKLGESKSLSDRFWPYT